MKSFIFCSYTLNIHPYIRTTIFPSVIFPNAFKIILKTFYFINSLLHCILTEECSCLYTFYSNANEQFQTFLIFMWWRRKYYYKSILLNTQQCTLCVFLFTPVMGCLCMFAKIILCTRLII